MVIRQKQFEPLPVVLDRLSFNRNTVDFGTVQPGLIYVSAFGCSSVPNVTPTITCQY